MKTTKDTKSAETNEKTAKRDLSEAVGSLDRIARIYDIDIHSNDTFGWSVYVRSGIGSQCIANGNDKVLEKAILAAVKNYSANSQLSGDSPDQRPVKHR